LKQPRDNDGYFSDPKGRMTWVKIHGNHGNSPEQMWEKLYSKHANIAFIFSGDQSRTVAMRLDRGNDAGQVVHALLSDYKSSGPLRIYRFIPAENRVQVITYDTTEHVLVEAIKEVPGPAEHQFSIDYSMTPGLSP
jgi:hypothetical protein